ncbi:response regulator [Candidatus Marinamargulisbacteria bacterium SCGC AG-439-L15]|nr:response regulator [Candidatus Marinamargulisbacteria bacterium SCGC AG-439-L15]
MMIKKVPRVLIVEDEVIIAEDIRHIVEREGYCVVGAVSSGQAAITMVEKTKPDIVLMDICLQDKEDGITTAAFLKLCYQIPVIFITAYSDKDKLDRVKDVDPSGYIVKPYTKELICANIHLALHKRAKEQSLQYS